MLSELDRQETRRALKAASSGGQAVEAVKLARELIRSGKPADTMFCASAFDGLKETLVKDAGCKRIKTFIVRSVTIEPVLPFLAVEAVLSGCVLDVEIGGFGSYIDEMLDPDSLLGRSKANLVLVLLDLEEIAGRLESLCADGSGAGLDEEIAEAVMRVEQMLQTYRSNCAGRVILQGCVVPGFTSLGDVGDANLRYSLPSAVKELNRQLAETCRGISDCFFFDVDQVAGRFGKGAWRDSRLFLASRLPLSPGAFSSYAQALARTIHVLFRAPRKVLCTDLDNTLWGGVLGEDGPMGIATGGAFPGNCYQEYQRYLERLSKRGVLLATVSKNNPEDVNEAFALRSADLALKLDDFVAHKIGWSDKTEAIQELADELSLGLSSFVFVDDNAVECEAVRRNLPEVAVVQVPAEEPWKFRELLARECFFDSAVVTAEDLGRADEYKAQTQRASLGKTTASRDEFLHSLDIVCTFISALEAPLARSVQLLEKTNQFNLTTRRLSSTDVERLALAPGGQAVAIRVRDRFGDAGVVGLALARQEGDRCIVENLLLSCRVIGRGIETALLANIAEEAVRLGCTWLIGEYIETKKNAPCASFYPLHGFERVSESEEDKAVRYQLDLKQHMPISPSWLSLERNSPYERASAVLTT